MLNAAVTVSVGVTAVRDYFAIADLIPLTAFLLARLRRNLGPN
jgi:hypothetical protein